MVMATVFVGPPVLTDIADAQDAIVQSDMSFSKLSAHSVLSDASLAVSIVALLAPDR